MGKEADVIRARFPDVLAVTGPQQYEEVVAAVHEAAPPVPSPFVDLVPEAGPQAHAAPLQLFEDFRGLQPPLRLLHHPAPSRRPRQPPPRRDPARGREAGRRRHEGAAGHQPGYERLRRRHPAPAAAVERRRGPRPHDRPVARARQARRLGAAPLCLPLPARERRHPADGRGARPPLPRHPLPARQPRRAAPNAPPGERREGARADPQLARAGPRPRHPLELRRRLPRRDRGGFRLSARLARGSAARSRRRVQVRGRRRRARNLDGRPGARGASSRSATRR